MTQEELTTEQLEFSFMDENLFDIDYYADLASNFAIYPERGSGSLKELSYLALGLTGESGEVAEKIKKFIRDGTIDYTALSKELGDVFWYLTQLSLAIGMSPARILTDNIIKLERRKNSNTISGSGDDR